MVAAAGKVGVGVSWVMRFFATMLFLIPLCAQQPKEGGKRPPPEPKNLKVLKIAPSELIPTMRSYAAALGEECSYCHMGRDFASD